MTESILPQKQAPRQYRTVEDILSQHCPEAGCGCDLSIVYFHVGGYASLQPFVVCTSDDGGYAHLSVRIPERLAHEYWDVVQAMDEAYTIWEEETCEEVAE